MKKVILIKFLSRIYSYSKKEKKNLFSDSHSIFNVYVFNVHVFLYISFIVSLHLSFSFFNALFIDTQALLL